MKSCANHELVEIVFFKAPQKERCNTNQFNRDMNSSKGKPANIWILRKRRFSKRHYKQLDVKYRKMKLLFENLEIKLNRPVL